MTACTNSREAVNCIVTERCRQQEERGQDGAAVDRKTMLQGSFSSGTARDVVVGSSPTGGFYFLLLTSSLLLQIKFDTGFLESNK